MSHDYLRYVSEGFTHAKIIHKSEATLAKLKNTKQSAFISTYHYNEDHLKYFQEHHSVAGIRDLITNKLWYDLDVKAGMTLEDVRKECIFLVKKIMAFGVEETAIMIVYSGNRSFHLYIDTKHTFTPNEVLGICSFLAKDVKSFDTTMYDANQVFRAPLTRHEKTGLIAIPLTLEQLETCTADEIKEMAKSIDDFIPEEIESYFQTNIELSQALLSHKNDVPEVKINEPKIISMDIGSLNKEAMPKGWDLARWALFNGYFSPGNRSHALLCLAAYLAKSFSADHTYRMLKGTCELQAQRTGQERFSDEELYNNIIMQVYGPSWRGGTFSLTDPASWLYQYAAEMGLLQEATLTVSRDILTTDEVGKLFEAFAMNIDKNRIQIGIKELDEALDMLVGRVYVIAGSPGCGKTSLLFQIFEGLSAQGNKAIFFSFDMSLQDCFQKLIQKEFKITAKQVFDQYKDPARRDAFHKLFNEKYSNIIFVNSSGMTVDAMRDRILQAEKVYGEIRVVAVDYMTLTQSEKSDSNEHSKSVIQGLKGIATEMRKCVISLNQPNKANQKINEPLSGYGGIQGSSAVQELANVILWCYRPLADPNTYENDKYYSIECMKNRHGSMFSVDLGWNGLTGTVSSLTPAQKSELARLKQELKEMKNSNNSNNY